MDFAQRIKEAHENRVDPPPGLRTPAEEFAARLRLADKVVRLPTGETFLELIDLLARLEISLRQLEVRVTALDATPRERLELLASERPRRASSAAEAAHSHNLALVLEQVMIDLNTIVNNIRRTNAQECDT